MLKETNAFPANFLTLVLVVWLHVMITDNHQGHQYKIELRTHGDH